MTRRSPNLRPPPWRRCSRLGWRGRKMRPISSWKSGRRRRVMQAYDAARFDPPAPVALVTVKSDPSLGIVIPDVPMLLDTGADVSLLPSPFAAPLVLPGAKQYELEAFDGTRSTAPAVFAELLILGKSFRGQFLLID